MLTRAVHAGGDDAAVDRGDALERLGRVARDDLDDLRQRVLLVARVDALGRVADEEVASSMQARVLLEDGHADLLGGAGIDGRLVDDGRAAFQVAADRSLAPSSGAKSGWCASSIGVGTATTMKSASRSAAGSVGDRKPRRRTQLLGAHFAGRIDELAIGLDLRGRQVEADRCGSACRTRRRAAGRHSPGRRRRWWCQSFMFIVALESRKLGVTQSSAHTGQRSFSRLRRCADLGASTVEGSSVFARRLVAGLEQRLGRDAAECRSGPRREAGWPS